MILNIKKDENLIRCIPYFIQLCTSISDPKSDLEIVNIDEEPSQDCERVVGEGPRPWNCTASVMFAEVNTTVQTYCKATYNGSEISTKLIEITIGTPPQS